MSNHVTQVLKAEGPNALNRMRAYFTDFDVIDDLSKKREQWRGFDFGKIIERPAIVDTIRENGSDRYIPFLMELDCAYQEWERLRTSNWVQLKERPLPAWPGRMNMDDGWMERHLRHTFGDEDIDNAYRVIKCFAQTGHKGWYDWARANWGTKWNAYSSATDPEGVEDAVRIKFNTAWSVPLPVLRALAEREPSLHFSYVAFDEGWNFYARGQGSDARFIVEHYRSPLLKSDDDVIAAHVECYGREPEPDEEEDEGDSLAKAEG